MKKRRQYTAQFKSKVAIEALREQRPIHEIAQQYEIHPSMVSDWKKALQKGAGSLFESPNKKEDTAMRQKQKEDRLFKQIGHLQVQVDFLKESCDKLGVPIPTDELH